MRLGFCLVVVMVVFDQWGGQKGKKHAARENCRGRGQTLKFYRIKRTASNSVWLKGRVKEVM